MTTTLITTAGKQAIAEAIANKTTLKIASIAVGDGGGATYTPSVSQTALKGRKWSGELNRKVVNPENQKQIIFEGLIAPGIGGFFIREVGLFDDNNVLFAISDFPESFKATADQYELYIRMILEVANTDVTNIIVNNDLVYATKGYVDTALQRDIEKKVDKVTGKGLSTNDYTTVDKNKLDGISTGANKTTYTDSVTSTSITTAATPNAVKQAYDKASTAQKEVDALEQVVVEHQADDVKHVTSTEKQYWSGKQDALSIENRRKISFGTATPTGGVDGDIYFQYE